MPKRVPEGENKPDPVRSRLAASAAAPVEAYPVEVETVLEEVFTIHSGDEKPLPSGQGRNIAQTSSQQRRAPKFVAKDRLTVHRKVMFTEDEAKRNEETTEMIAAAFGNPATYSQITRAMWSVLTRAEDALKISGKRSRHLNYPSKGDHIGMAEYEDALAEFIANALRRA